MDSCEASRIIDLALYHAKYTFEEQDNPTLIVEVEKLMNVQPTITENVVTTPADFFTRYERFIALWKEMLSDVTDERDPRRWHYKFFCTGTEKAVLICCA